MGVLAHYGCRLIIQVVVVDEYPPFYVKRFEYPEKRYINVTNYYYYQFKQNKNIGQNDYRYALSSLPVKRQYSCCPIKQHTSCTVLYCIVLNGKNQLLKLHSVSCSVFQGLSDVWFAGNAVSVSQGDQVSISLLTTENVMLLKNNSLTSVVIFS